eukprot:TRINITY_DN99191_c0_g1_i1.p1 TRINITY_DN99191_c0_g1~~TRINITY_DN99191_c0_g1_i1.p1  ORF type:complete len:217 (+),score=35.75 TRINITY_DN99191_c0_g1_i1:69-653(+)
MDVAAPRAVNGQAVILRESPVKAGSLEVLLQRRSERMPVMPGYLATVGGMRDRSDPDSRHTTIREVAEETGLECGVLLPPVKFAEGAKCDWFVLKLCEPISFSKKAADSWECSDMTKSLPYLPPSSELASCFGHAWVPTDELCTIEEIRQPLMGGLVSRVQAAVRHLTVIGYHHGYDPQPTGCNTLGKGATRRP